MPIGKVVSRDAQERCDLKSTVHGRTGGSCAGGIESESGVGPSCPMVAILAGVPGFGDRRRVDRASRAVHAQTRETVNPP